MKRSRTRLTCLILLIAGLQTRAQLKFPVTNNDLRTNLQKIVADYPKQFSTLKGVVTADNPQTVEYASLLDFKGARDNTIIQYKSARPVYSWQANLLNSEEFEEASKKYKWLCGQLKVMTITIDGYGFTMSGKFEEATESKKFVSTVFKLTPNASNMPKLRIEATMQFEFPEWKVQLLVYEKEKEDKDRGDVIED